MFQILNTMKRKLFIIWCISFCLFTFLQAEKPVKFAIISDIHNDIMHDAEERLSVFLEAAKQNKVDFIIQLGDFCQQKEENRPFLNLWNTYSGDKYMVLGNHDMDNCSKEDYMAFTGMPERYYSFDKGNFHFIVLDPNNLYTNNQYIPYKKGNFYVDTKKRAFIDPEQMEWLEKDLAATNKQCFIFSHQSLERVVQNSDLVQKLLEAENKKAGYKKVVAAFSGHDHTSYMKDINGIAYIQINSASNQWLGEKYTCTERFSEEVNKKKPALKYTAPYQDSLFGIVTLKNNQMKLKGTKSIFISPTPQDLGADKTDYPLVPWIEDVKLKF